MAATATGGIWACAAERRSGTDIRILYRYACLLSRCRQGLGGPPSPASTEGGDKALRGRCGRVAKGVFPPQPSVCEVVMMVMRIGMQIDAPLFACHAGQEGVWRVARGAWREA